MQALDYGVVPTYRKCHMAKEMLVDGKTSEYDVSHFAIDRRPEGKPIIRDGPVEGP